MSNVGFRIIENVERPPKEIVERFRGLPSSNIGDMMNRLYCMSEYIKSMNKKSMVGTAFTVKAPIGDNLMFHIALDMAKPGDIIVVDGGSALNRSLAGEIMLTYAQVRGIAGVVVDGAMRDFECMDSLDIAVFAKGITPQGPYKNGPGEINVPIACGGQVVRPGDILVGDPDGIVVIPKEFAVEIAELANNKFKSEEICLNHYHYGKLDEQEHKEQYNALLCAAGYVKNEEAV